MAWLQNLADRAENLLNKIDQNAATVLNDSSKPTELDIPIEDISTEEVTIEPITRSRSSNVSLNRLANNSSFQSSPIKLKSPSPDVVVSSDIPDSGIVFSVSPEKSKNGSVSENVLEKTCKESKSDKVSSSSSVHHSFVLAEESQLFYEKLAKLEFENQDLNKQLLNMQHLYSEIKNENAGFQFQIERLNEQVTEAQTEKEQYIARAQRILQEVSLKNDNATAEETDNVFARYNEELRGELEFQQMKNEEITLKNNQLIKEIQSLQMQHQVIQNGLQMTNQSLEQNLANERKFRSIAEDDCGQKNNELYLKDQEIAKLREEVGAKTSELLQIKETMKQKSNININEDFESRIRSLTQTLMMKQSNLETVTTERNALRLQLEKLETEHRTNLTQLHRSQAKVIDVTEFDDSTPIPRFVRVSPFDAGVTRRVKHAYSTLDAISIRTGIFLRRYPVARVFVFIYMVLLHIWVFLILFWNAPSNR